MRVAVAAQLALGGRARAAINLFASSLRNNEPYLCINTLVLALLMAVVMEVVMVRIASPGSTAAQSPDKLTPSTSGIRTYALQLWLLRLPANFGGRKSRSGWLAQAPSTPLRKVVLPTNIHQL